MVDDNNRDDDYTDDDLNETSVPDIDSPEAQLEMATRQAAETAMEEEEEEVKDESDDDDDDIDWSEFEGGNDHVTLDKPAYQRAKISPNQIAMLGLKIGEKELRDLLMKKDLTDLDEEKIESLSDSDRRLISLAQQLSVLWQDLYYDDADKKGDWHQTLLHNETKLGPGKIRPENMKDPIQAIRASMGQGSVVQIPLWATGLWVSLRAPSINSLVELEQRLRLEKATLGRLSNGMVFSNNEVYTVEIYARFALEHVEAINYEFKTADTVEELMSVIKTTDYQQLINGLLMAMYPDGYRFRQYCVADPDKCRHIDDMVLNFARMSIVDRSKFTDNQALMMASRRTKRDSKWLDEYQKKFTFHERRFTVNKNLTAILSIPTLQEQIDAGHVWIEGITNATNDAFGQKLSEVDRIRHIVRAGNVSNLRQYAHWVDHFEYSIQEDTSPTVIDVPEKKDEMLSMLSETPETSQALQEAIVNYFRETATSYVGLPKIKCPSCQGEPADETHPFIIPLDVTFIFFTLAASKISQIENAAR